MSHLHRVSCYYTVHAFAVTLHKHKQRIPLFRERTNRTTVPARPFRLLRPLEECVSPSEQTFALNHRPHPTSRRQQRRRPRRNCCAPPQAGDRRRHSAWWADPFGQGHPRHCWRGRAPAKRFRVMMLCTKPDAWVQDVQAAPCLNDLPLGCGSIKSVVIVCPSPETDYLFYWWFSIN